MPGPPPPPPGPPPPPMAGLSLSKKSSNSSSGGGDMRGALLSQIQKGTSLKKVTTVDKSKPIVAGKITGGESSNSSSPLKTSRGPTLSNKTSPDSSSSSPVSSSSSRQGGGGFANLTDELQYKLTLKKNKQSPIKESKSITETKESSPPSVSSNSFVNEIKSKQSMISPSHQTKTSSSSISSHSSIVNNNNTSSSINDAIANKSSLFSKNQPVTPPIQKIINHGKPNLAPKPPPQLSLAVNNNNSSSNSSLNNSVNNIDGNRKNSVARHQSMKSPRSPPIGSPSGPFNSENHFGTIRNPSSHNKIQDALNLQISVQKSAQRPTNKPPPPPVPNRNIATNLSQAHAKSTTALNNNSSSSDNNLSAPTRRLPNSGSSNNISNMERQNDATDLSAPPLPPHRLSSSHKAQQQQQQQQQQQIANNINNSINNQAPPEVPKRHSSMRNSIENGGNRYPSPNPNQPITRLVVDLEARYSLLFHSISEFPAPKQYMNIDKSYPSRASLTTTARPNGI